MPTNEDGLISGIGLVMLGVSDLERSIGFYRDRLGLALQSKGGGFAFFAAGGVTLALSEELGRAKEQRIGAVEIVLSVNDVHAAHKALARRGVAFSREPRIVTGQQWSANFTDPDGHELSILGPSANAPR